MQPGTAGKRSRTEFNGTLLELELERPIVGNWYLVTFSRKSRGKPIRKVVRVIGHTERGYIRIQRYDGSEGLWGHGRGFWKRTYKQITQEEAEAFEVGRLLAK